MDRSDICGTIKVKPWGKDQGEFVEINAADFDPNIHKLADGESAPVAEQAADEPEPSKKPAPKRRKGK